MSNKRGESGYMRESGERERVCGEKEMVKRGDNLSKGKTESTQREGEDAHRIAIVKKRKDDQRALCTIFQ